MRQSSSGCPRYIPAKECEPASHFTADLRGLAPQRHGLHDSADLYDFVELFGVRECFVDALPARFENSVLLNRFRRTRNLLLGSSPWLSSALARPSACHRNPSA